jgi:N-methylhydantoinase B/oxoprolinase/acetone carboxylase alpha subunit
MPQAILILADPGRVDASVLQGAQVKSFKLVKAGKFDEEGIVKIMSEEPAQYPGCSGTRTLSDVSGALSLYR